jgi:phosphoenolpyruvate-dependent sugar phosphotransferase system EIIA component
MAMRRAPTRNSALAGAGRTLSGLSSACVHPLHFNNQLRKYDDGEAYWQGSIRGYASARAVATEPSHAFAITKPFGLFVRLKNPIDFDAIDGRPIDLVFLLMLPASSQLEQLNALAAVARKLREPEVLKKLRGAATGTELYRASSATKKGKAGCGRRLFVSVSLVGS